MKEAFLANQGRGARWVGRAFQGTLGREDHLDQMESQVRWAPLVQMEFLDLLAIWDLLERWALLDSTD